MNEKLIATETNLPGVVVLEPQVFGDDRGFFFESFNEEIFAEKVGYPVNFVQDNHSKSYFGVLRGLHYQINQAQGKLIRVVEGAVFDVAVDIRTSSPTFAQWFGIELTADNKKQLWVPPGFAHGFAVVSDVAQVLYKTTAYYAPSSERSIRWDDPAIGITWPRGVAIPLLSEKDEKASALAEAELPTYEA